MVCAIMIMPVTNRIRKLAYSGQSNTIL